MKQTVPSNAGQEQKNASHPTRSPGRQQGFAAPGRLTQLAALINGSPRVQALTQLKDNAQRSQPVQSLAHLAANINQADPAQLQGVPVNDDADLEREADVMGAKALATPQASQMAAGTGSAVQLAENAEAPVIQRLTTARAPENKQIYSVSDTGKVAAGMGTPNHELYLTEAGKISDINKALAASPLEVYAGATRDLFTHSFTAVELRFKRALGPEKVNLQAGYEKHVKPRIEDYRGGTLRQTEEVLPKKESNVDVDGVCKELRSATAALELFKKLVQTSLASAPDPDGVEAAFQLVSGMEKVLYSDKATFAGTVDILADIYPLLKEPAKNGIPANQLVFETIAQLYYHAIGLLSEMPKHAELDLISFHKRNFQVDALATVQRTDSNLLLYRACDVMASTVLGNELTPENAQQLKVYAASKEAFHYAAKILTEGADWVTLESFAASARDRSITGVEDLRNLDQTWQYVMYGSVRDEHSPDKGLSDEDRFFEAYTKMRYYLKGIKKPGKFESRAAKKLAPQEVHIGLFSYLFPKATGLFARFSDTPDEQAQKLLEQLKKANVVSDLNLVNPKLRQVKDLKKYLDSSYHQIADKIHHILLGRLPSSAYIQAAASSDAANIAGWKALMGSGEEEVQSFLAETTGAVFGGKRASVVSQDTWSQLGKELASPTVSLSTIGPSPTTSLETTPPLITPPLAISPDISSTTLGPPLTTSTSPPSKEPLGGSHRVLPTSREEIIERGLAGLAELRRQWRLAGPERAEKDPLHYAVHQDNIRSITFAPHHIPLVELDSQVQEWLNSARTAWLG